MRSAGLALTLLLSLVLAESAAAFGTINGLGQRAEHERITRAALGCAARGEPEPCFEPTSLRNLAGGSGTFGAVGSPDSDEVFNEDAHCDDADILPGLYPTSGEPYPNPRARATAQLAACRAHLLGRFRQGIAAAARVLDDGRIAPRQVDLSSSCTFTGGVPGRAKCDALEGFGRALHGVQDFYSHSNWSDEHDPRRAISLTNPPGMARDGVAPVLDFRRSMGAVPTELSTGCFTLNPFGCRGRVTHGTLNKDKGLVDPAIGAASDPRTDRGELGRNFERAVRGAILETRRQWVDYVDELEEAYGARRAALIACALTNDQPLPDCD